MTPTPQATNQEAPASKPRPYRAPRVIRYGSLNRLTSSGTLTAMEDGMGADMEAML